MHVWDEWIGPSPARTLIAMECKAVWERDAIKPPAKEKEASSKRTDWPTEDIQHFYIYPVPDSQATVLWIGGRSFMVGAPSGIERQLPKQCELPDNVILLSWDFEHTKGLAGYCREWNSRKPKGAQLQIWTSDWIWEHLVEGELAPSETYSGSAEVRFSPNQQNEPRIAHTTFETEHVEYFAPRIELSLTYGVGKVNPQLFAHFRFFDSHLIVAFETSGAGTSSPVGVLSTNDYQKLIRRVYRSYPQSNKVLASILEKRLKQLSDAAVLGPITHEHGSWWYRYSLQSGTFELVLRPDSGTPEDASSRNAELVRDWVGCFAEVRNRSIDISCVPENEAFENESSWNRTLFGKWAGLGEQPRNPAKPDPPRSAIEFACRREVSLVIGCGAPPTRWHGKLTPDRRLVLGERDVSVLEAKLLQYAVLPQTRPAVFGRTIYILVSPATETVVRNELSRIQREHPDRFEGVRFEILRNRVAPRYERTNQSLGLFRQSDGGFQYNPAGHFELIWRLHALGLPGLFYFTNVTNMGINVTHDVDVLRQHMAAVEAAAVFELVLHDKRKEGIGPGSYWVANGDRKSLIKPVYCGYEGETHRTWPQNRDAVVSSAGDDLLYMSTGSVLLDMERFRGDQFHAIATVPHYARASRPFRTHSLNSSDHKRWAVQMERDLDQITWVKGLKCDGLVISEKEGSPRRFFAVKREADLYQKSYQELADLYRDLESFRAVDLQTGDIPNTPLALVGAEQHDPWGDGLLRHLKGEPPSDVEVSETWESSAYRKGVSLVQKNALETVSLRNVVPDLEEKVNVMGKLLDCAGSLSIQVHPSKNVCRALRDHGHEIEDDAGKEENFFVVRATGEQIFYLGLDARKISAVFESPGAAAVGKDWFEHAIKGKKHEIDRFGDQALEGLDPPSRFSELLHETMSRTPPISSEASDACQIFDLRRSVNIEQPLTDESVAGILFIMALKTVNDVVSANQAKYQSDSGIVDRMRTFALQYLNKLEGLRPDMIIHVPPGVIHAAGPGCLLVEASEQSDNTFRIFDHGREYEPDPRNMHYVYAAVAFSEDSFLDKIKQRRLVTEGGLPSDSAIKMKTQKVNPPVRGATAAQKHSDPSFPCNDPETHGHTLICTEGRLSVSATWGGKPSRVASVSQAHSLFFPPRAGELSIQAAEHEVSRYAMFCSHTKPAEPRLAIVVGGTHFQFVYRAYPDPPRYASHLWYDLRATGNDFTWQMRLSHLRTKLREFLKDMPSVSLCALSWPGDAGNLARLTAHILDCDGTSVKELCEDIPVNHCDCKVMFDADADLAAELKEVGGRLQDDSGNPLAGWLLNFGSGVCMSIASVTNPSERSPSGAKVSSSEINLKGQTIAIGRIGRTLWLDPMTRDWHLTQNWTARSLKTPEGLPSGVIRLSDMLSTTAVALRLLASPLGEGFLRDFGQENYTSDLQKCRTAAQGVAPADRAEKVSNLIQEFRPHLNAAIKDMFDWLDKDDQLPIAQNLDEAVRLRGEFVEEIGRDYGDVVAGVLGEFPVLQNRKKVVIGGFGGSHFGNHGKNRDRFIEAIAAQLHAGNRFREITVMRSSASGSAFRLLHARDWDNLFT